MRFPFPNYILNEDVQHIILKYVETMNNKTAMLRELHETVEHICFSSENWGYITLWGKNNLNKDLYFKHNQDGNLLTEVFYNNNRENNIYIKINIEYIKYPNGKTVVCFHRIF
jgi:hypothetical protein